MEVAIFSKGVGYSKSDLKDSGIPIILYGRLYTNYEIVIEDVDTFVDGIFGAVYSKGGEIITPSSGETSEDISIASVVKKSGILLGGDLNIIYPQSFLNPIFIAVSISNGKPHKEMAKRAQGKSVVHLHNVDLSKIEIDYPSIDEQTRISSYFITLDHLITLHQSKSFGHILKAIVSCTLSWEQRKFVELFLEKRDKTQSEDEDVLLSCAITGIYLNSELFSHFRGTSNIGYLKIKKNDLILSAQNLHLGNANVNLLFEHGIISPAYKVYELNKCDQYFVQSWVKKDSTKDFFLNATTEGASQCRKNIDWCILNNQLIVIPSLYEQFRIGKLFNSLNHLITLHQLEPFQLIFKAIAYRIIDYTKSKPPNHIK